MTMKPVAQTRGTRLYAILLLSLSVVACTGTPVSMAPLPPGPAADGLYRLGVGDRVKISTFNEPTLSGEYQIQGDGSISFPLIGQVPASGKSAVELQAAIAGALLRGGFLIAPKVSAEVQNFRPYFILGEVERPGRYPTFEGITINRAIATAGGFTYRANKKKVYVRRANEPLEHVVDTQSEAMVEPGDILRVAERYF